MDGVLLAAISAACGAPLGALITWLLRRNRDRTEEEQLHAKAAAAITTAATALVMPLQQNIEQLQRRVQRQEAELETLRPLVPEVQRLRVENARLNRALDVLRADLESRTRAEGGETHDRADQAPC